MPRYCDIVMKGGITSGIVYPAAVVEIAKEFVFKNVGGTSAGAIAAAVTAAAERRRAADGTTAGFDRVKAIPDYLATDSRLFKLFVPNSGTKALFRTVVGLFGRPRFKPAWLAKWFGLVWAFPIAAAIGAIPGIAFMIAAFLAGNRDIWFAGAVLLAIATIVAGMTIAIAIALLRDFTSTLPKNFYGMVTGVDDADRSSLNALCTWLTQELELIAGLEPGKIPLTFGMLWNAKADPAAPGIEEKPHDADVSLDMISTNVTWGRPYQFPNDVVFFFDPVEMTRFFPEHVVAWMKARSRTPRNEAEKALFARYAPDKLPLPLPGDLPVIVATRMSLAFPVLLSAVPLWGIDFTRPRPKEPPCRSSTCGSPTAAFRATSRSRCSTRRCRAGRRSRSISRRSRRRIRSNRTNRRTSTCRPTTIPGGSRRSIASARFRGSSRRSSTRCRTGTTTRRACCPDTATAS